MGHRTGVRGCDPAGTYDEHVCDYCGEKAFDDEFRNFKLATKEYCDKKETNER